MSLKHDLTSGVDEETEMTKLTLKERLEQKKKERAYLKKLEACDTVDGYDIRVSVDWDDWDAYIGENNYQVFQVHD